METDGLLPHLRVLATCPNPEPDQASPFFPLPKDPSQYYPYIHVYHFQNAPFPHFCPTNNLYTPPLYPIRATCPAHPILLDFPIPRVLYGRGYRSLTYSLLRFLKSPVTSSLLGPNILLSILFSNTISLRFSLSVSKQFSHQYKTTGKFMVLYILFFTFLDCKLEDKRFCFELQQALPDFNPLSISF